MALTWIIGTVLLIAGVVFVAWWTRPKAACPYCESEKVREIGRNPTHVTTYERFSGSDSGSTETMVRTHTQIKYTCEKCGENFEKTIIKTR